MLDRIKRLGETISSDFGLPLGFSVVFAGIFLIGSILSVKNVVDYFAGETKDLDTLYGFFSIMVILILFALMF